MGIKFHAQLIDFIKRRKRSASPTSSAVEERTPVAVSHEPDPNLLRAFAPLNRLKKENLQLLAREVRIRELGAEQLLFKEGDTDECTFYLLAGTIQLKVGERIVSTISGGSHEAHTPLAPGLPRSYSAWSASDVEFVAIDNDLLDTLFTWDNTGVYEVAELRRDVVAVTDDWMTTLLQKKAYHRIPAENIQAAFTRMQRIDYRAHDIVVKQGTPGNYFYVVASGKCVMKRETLQHEAGVRIAELACGDTFGDEALITGESHNETVTMSTNGTLMRLGLSDFHSLIEDSLLQRVDHRAAQRILSNGGRWLDVRTPNLALRFATNGAVNIPFHLLRLKLSALDKDAQYIISSDSMARSCAAAFMLSERGFDAYVLKSTHSSRLALSGLDRFLFNVPSGQ